MSSVTETDPAARHELRRAAALAMGGPRKLEKRAEAGQLNARERVDRLFDPESFRESGLFATSHLEADKDVTPADGKVTGTGDVDGRRAAVISYDFTVKGASSGQVSNKKMQHMKDLATRCGMPLVYLAESTGVRMPDIMGGTGMGSGNERTRFLRKRESPWASAVFGYAFGSATWHTVSSDFAVFRKGAVMAVSSPGLVSRATGQQVDAEALGGWKLHAEVTGFADAVANTDEEAIDLVRRFLAYLPSHNAEAAPVVPVTPGSGERSAEPALPRRSRARRSMTCARSSRSWPIRAPSSRSRRLRQEPRDVPGPDRRAKRRHHREQPDLQGWRDRRGGVRQGDDFLTLCDSYNIPIVFLVDQPGFLIGLEAERNKVAGKIINWMNALALVTVPKVTVMMRKNYGQAYANMGGGFTADATAAWWSAEVSFMDPRSAVGVVYGVTQEDDPELYERRLAEMARESTAYDVARVYGVQDVIDPADTRGFLIGALRDNDLARTGGVGEHLLSTWPTSF